MPEFRSRCRQIRRTTEIVSHVDSDREVWGDSVLQVDFSDGIVIAIAAGDFLREGYRPRSNTFGLTFNAVFTVLEDVDARRPNRGHHFLWSLWSTSSCRIAEDSLFLREPVSEDDVGELRFGDRKSFYNGVRLPAAVPDDTG